MSTDPLSIASVLAFIQACREGIKIAKAMKGANKEAKLMAHELGIEIQLLDTLGEHVEKIIKDEAGTGSIITSSAFKELATYMEARLQLVAFVQEYNAAVPSRIKRFMRRATWLFRKERLQDITKADKRYNCNYSVYSLHSHDTLCTL
ncbi:hypothetical protein M422DRAFT_239236 [Sphaerobolus stellatus SS14]|nr:hypothetical protein M422DRAFT_239236 [Sphaerobolus stellatus SS14]